jgi:BirA family transcriptional regulator, biotin operon repressor / biotin---[acetyl-CoA-carboxylase] ligase
LFDNYTFFQSIKHIHLAEVVSTNDLMKQLLDENAIAEGTLISADYQTKGHGQAGTSWESEKGRNMICSFLLTPQLSVAHQVYINLCIALSVRDTITHMCSSEKVNIKWPNDIYVNGFKVAGILIENSLQGDCIKHSIAGVGINLNQQLFESPKASSVRTLTGSIIEPVSCISNWIHFLQVRYRQLLKEKSKLWTDYHEALYKYKETVWVKHEGQTMEVTILGIDEYGRLHATTGRQQYFFTVKEIEWL